jgi:hypothetical protein
VSVCLSFSVDFFWATHEPQGEGCIGSFLRANYTTAPKDFRVSVPFMPRKDFFVRAKKDFRAIKQQHKTTVVMGRVRCVNGILSDL